MSALRRTLALILLIAAALAFAWFAIANRAEVDLSLSPLPYTARLPLFLLILFSLMLGAFITSIAAHFVSLGRRWDYYRAQKRIKALENEIGGLKTEKTILPSAKKS